MPQMVRAALRMGYAKVPSGLTGWCTMARTTSVPKEFPLFVLSAPMLSSADRPAAVRVRRSLVRLTALSATRLRAI